MGRPRVLIWGVVPEGAVDLRWLDWTLDDFGTVGGDAVAKAEARRWHGAVQAGLEAEALMQRVQAPPDALPLDANLTGTVAGHDAAAGQARGYQVVASGGNRWWRVEPATGPAPTPESPRSAMASRAALPD